MRFDFARLASVKAIMEGAQKGVIQLSRPVSQELLAKIQRAVVGSKRTRNEVRTYLRAQGSGTG